MIDEIRVSLPGGDDRPGVLARPEGTGPFPGVIVIHDLIGLMPDTRRHCQRFAEAGYVALAPDLYDGKRIGCTVRTMLDVMRGGRYTLPVIAAARAQLAALPEVDAQRVGITGFCMGGGFALLAAADDEYAVAAPFYGVVPGKADRLSGLCPTLAQYGERDRSFKPHAERLSEHLKTLGIEHELLMHPGVGHSFMNDHDWAPFKLSKYTRMRAQYDAPTEKVAWDKLLGFFAEHMPAA